MRSSFQHHLATTHLKLLKLLLCAHSLWEVNKPATAPDQATILCHPGAGPFTPSPVHCTQQPDPVAPTIPISSRLTCKVLTQLPLFPLLTTPRQHWPYWAYLYCPISGMIFPGYLWGSLTSLRFSLGGAFSDHPLENSTFQSLFSPNCFSSSQHLLALDILHNMFVCVLSVSPSRR